MIKVLHFLFIALEVIAIFNLLIIVHELGHFLAARWRGLVVDEFGIWFGKPLWRKKIGGVWYSLGSIPAGGFVKLPQLADMSTIEGESETPREQLPRVRPLDKIIVAFAGPLFSFLLAIVMATVVWGIGKPVSDIESTTTIGYIQPGGPADVAGLKIGDKILEIDGKPVTRFMGATNSVIWNIIRSEGRHDPLQGRTRRRNPHDQLWLDERENRELAPARFAQSLHRAAAHADRWDRRPEFARGAGRPQTRRRDHRGQREADHQYRRTRSVPEAERRWADRAHRAAGSRSAPDEPGGPAAGSRQGEARLDPGVLWGRITLTHPTPWQQVSESAMTIFNMVGALVSPKSDVKVSHFSGPVGIMNLYYRMFEGEEGWRMAIALSVLINVNLALLNLLPLPVLDGGHITLALIEAVRRKPVNVRLVEIVQTACAVLLIGFMLFVTFFDVGDIFGSKSAPEPEPVEAPSAPEIAKPTP
jgi:regulator of sigma E protease